MLASVVDSPLLMSEVGIEVIARNDNGITTGRVYHDSNGNGRRDGGEDRLANWGIFGDRNGNLTRDSHEASAITNHRGDFTLNRVRSNAALIPVAPIRADQFDSVSPESLVNTQTRRAQQYSDVAVHDNGSVVVWSSFLQDGSGWGIFGQRFNVAGQKVGGEFQVNSTTRSHQVRPSVTARSNGKFYVAWESLQQDNNPKFRGWGVYAQAFGANGRKLGNEVRVNQTTYGHQWSPEIEVNDVGAVAVVWQGFGRTGPTTWGQGLFVRTFNGNLHATSGEIRFNQTNYGVRQQMDVTGLPGGGFAVAFQGNAKPDNNGIYVRKLTNRGQADGPGKWLVNQSGREGRQYQPSIDANADGQMIISWTSDRGDRSGKGVYAQVMNRNFTIINSPALVNQHWAGTQWRSSAKWVGDDQFVVTWEGRGGNDGDGVFGRVFNSGSIPVGEELRLSDSRSGLQRFAAIDSGSNGVVGTWHGKGNSDHFGVYSRFLIKRPMVVPPPVPPTPPTPPPANGSISGFTFNDLNGDGIRNRGLISGTQPDIVFVVDTSGSTSNQFDGGMVGDLNNDGSANTILDGEIAGFEALVDQLISLNLGDTATVSIVEYNSDANTILDQVLPNRDDDGNGVSDIKDALRSLNDTGSTNYEAALQEAIRVLESHQTSRENGNVIFLSDGMPNNDSFVDEAEMLRDNYANVRAFGVGTGSDLDELQKIDAQAAQFVTADELLIAFSGIGDGNGGGNNPITPPTSRAEPGLGGAIVYLDRNNNGLFDRGEQFVLSGSDNPSTSDDETGTWTFTGLPAGTYVVRQVPGPGRRITTPSPAVFQVVLAADADFEGLVFGVQTTPTATV